LAELKKGAVTGFPDLKDMPSFEISGVFVDRAVSAPVNPDPGARAKKVSNLENNKTSINNGRL
jgi:hypothetical protein